MIIGIVGSIVDLRKIILGANGVQCRISFFNILFGFSAIIFHFFYFLGGTLFDIK